MGGESIKRIDANMEAALERSIKRFEERLNSAYDRMVGSEPVSFEERGKEYLTIAGDVAAWQQWFSGQVQIHGFPLARTLALQFEEEGEKFVDKTVGDARQDNGTPLA